MQLQTYHIKRLPEQKQSLSKDRLDVFVGFTNPETYVQCGCGLVSRGNEKGRRSGRGGRIALAISRVAREEGTSDRAIPLSLSLDPRGIIDRKRETGNGEGGGGEEEEEAGITSSEIRVLRAALLGGRVYRAATEKDHC